MPDDLKAFVHQVEGGSCARDLAFRSRCDETLCSAIDAFYANRKRFDPASAHAMEGLILGRLTEIASRDLGMYKSSTSEKLLQSRAEST